MSANRPSTFWRRSLYVRRPTPVALAGALCAVALLCESPPSDAAISTTSDPHVTFEAAGPAGLKITGTTTELTVGEDAGQLTITVPLGKLTTGIALRDQHMKEKYLEVAKYPDATLTLSRAALKLPAAGEKLDADASGTLKLHGQTRPVPVHYVANGEAGGLSVHGNFHINMNEFGISVPSYLGVTVKPGVDVTAAFRVSGS